MPALMQGSFRCGAASACSNIQWSCMIGHATMRSGGFPGFPGKPPVFLFANSRTGGQDSMWMQIRIRMLCRRRAAASAARKRAARPPSMALARNRKPDCFRRDTPGADRAKSFLSNRLSRALLCLDASNAAHPYAARRTGAEKPWKEANHTREPPGWAGSRWA
jgi:hypothetical protein